MEGDDNVGGANNDVGEGASSDTAADPSAPGDGAAAAAAAGGGVVDNSTLVAEVGNDLTATRQTVHSENGTPVTVKVVRLQLAIGPRGRGFGKWCTSLSLLFG